MKRNETSSERSLAMFTAADLNSMFKGLFSVYVKDYSKNEFGYARKQGGCTYYSNFKSAWNRMLKENDSNNGKYADVEVYVRNNDTLADGRYIIDSAKHGKFDLIRA